MTEQEAQTAKAAFQKKLADGQPRTGKAARACCPAVPRNVIAKVSELHEEAQLLEAYTRNRNWFYHRLATGMVAGLAELHADLIRLSEEASAGNIKTEERP